MSLPLPHQGRQEQATGGGAPITVGLVNNVPGGGRHTTERQFRRLLSGAPDAPAPTVRLRIFTFPEIARPPDAQSYIAGHYEAIDALWDSDLDGLIVSGTEPRAATLAEESYWPTLAKLVDWAEARTLSTIWSCLAAHAAVYRLDGIGRRALPAKLSGIFGCARLGHHPLLEGLPSRWHIPHSRCNEIAADQLIAHGYRVLVRSRHAGLDTLAKQGKALHVFLQGHPEYDGEALFREYRRDVRRFLAGERHCYPEMPQGYFTTKLADELTAFRGRALEHRHSALLAEFPTAATVRWPAPWSNIAGRFFANWLSYIAQQKYSYDVQSRAARSRLGPVPATSRAPALGRSFDARIGARQ